MSAFPITFIVSACLLAIFIIYFARTHSGQRKRGVDQESLLPLEEETPRVVGEPHAKDTKRNGGDGTPPRPQQPPPKAPR